MTKLKKTGQIRVELANFLKSRRERINPAELGFPMGNRRKVKGLRREEVSILSGVGLTWYTWLEQGKDISVSSELLDKISSVLRLNTFERDHLFLLAQNRLPVESSKAFNSIPPIIERMINKINVNPCYVWNLNWDIITYNNSADLLFKFSNIKNDELNFIWLLFSEPYMRKLITNWETQAYNILSSFRRDFIRGYDNSRVQELVDKLKKHSKEFSIWWDTQDVNASCNGIRNMYIEGLGEVNFEHMTLIIDIKKGLKMTYYDAITNGEAFNNWVIDNSRISEAP